MSIELSLAPNNELECKWGRLENAEADPKRPLHHLLLTTAKYVEKLMKEGPQRGPKGGLHSVTVDGQRIFAHVDYDGQRTTWELFEAHWWDGNGAEVMVGKWPD